MRSLWRRGRTAPRSPRCSAPPATCPGICALTACTVGAPALVLRMECPVADACRLRALGVYEGARLVVLDRRNGYLLDVRGARLAVDRRTAEAIVVRVASEAA